MWRVLVVIMFCILFMQVAISQKTIEEDIIALLAEFKIEMDGYLNPVSERIQTYSDKLSDEALLLNEDLKSLEDSITPENSICVNDVLGSASDKYIGISKYIITQQ